MSKKISEINKKFPALFYEKNEEVSEERNFNTNQLEKYGILNFIIEVTQIANASINEVLELPIATTFILANYSKDKNKYEIDEMKRWKTKK